LKAKQANEFDSQLVIRFFQSRQRNLYSFRAKLVNYYNKVNKKVIGEKQY